MKKLTLLLTICLSAACVQQQKSDVFPYDIPEEYLQEREDIPPFWVATTAEVNDFIKTKVHKGQWELLGHSAGGRPIYGVTYGSPRQGRGPAILIPACASSSPAFLMMYSAYKLNKQGDNIQP